MSDLKQQLIDDVTNKKTGLSEKDEYFLDILFDKCKGNIRAAMLEAGYHKDVPTREVTKRLKDHIAEASKVYLSANSAMASIAIVDVLVNPTTPGANTILKASKELLDRTGVQAPQEQTKIEARNVFILPAKQRDDE